MATTDLQGAPATLDPGISAPPSALAQPVEDSGGRLIVPSVGLDVPLGALSAVDGQITPPGFTSAYWVRNIGVSVADGAAGTVFVVMHALRDGGRGPGNYLTDVDAGTSTVAAGASIYLDGVEYRAIGWQALRKPLVAASPDIWASVPGRLQLITCLELPDGSPSRDNMIITATRVGRRRPKPPASTLGCLSGAALRTQPSADLRK